jgi:hypothetical protein
MARAATTSRIVPALNAVPREVLFGIGEAARKASRPRLCSAAATSVA